MRTKYIDLIDQTFDFPQNEFFLREERLFFHGIDLMRLVHEHGTLLNFIIYLKFQIISSAPKAGFARLL